MENKIIKMDRAIQMSSRKNLLEKYSPHNCLIDNSQVKTVEQALSSKAPSVGSFQSKQGRQFTEGLVTVWLMYLNKELNLNKPMTESQLNFCSIYIVEEYYYFKTSELTLLFKKIISGQYGEFYESLSPAKVLTCFKEYSKERFNLAEDNSQRNHKEEIYKSNI